MRIPTFLGSELKATISYFGGTGNDVVLTVNPDNCPATFNPDQDDDDNNGVGDICQDCPPNLTIYPYAPNQVTFEAQQNIVTSGAVTVLNATARLYQAGTGITLNAGFEVQLGAVFDAINQACTPSLQQGGEKQE